MPVTKDGPSAKEISAAFKLADVKLNGKERQGKWALVMLAVPWGEECPDVTKYCVSNHVDYGDMIGLMKRLIAHFEQG